MNNLGLGPSWLPKVGALLGSLGAAIELVPFDAPGAVYFKPYEHALIALGVSIVGFTSRQNNVSSETVGVAPTAKPSDNDPTK